MVLTREKQDIRNNRAREKRALLKVINIIQKIEPEEPLKEPLELNEIIEEPIKIIEEPIKIIEPLTKAEIIANKRRASLAVARSLIKPRGYYNDIINKKDIEIMKLQQINNTLYEMATLRIKPDLPDKDIPDYIYQTPQQQPQQPQQQQIKQQNQPLPQHQEQEYLSNHLYAQTLQSKIKNTMMQNMIRETFQ